MNKIILILFVFISLSACNNQSNDPEEIKKEIEAYNVEIMEIESKIHDLEKILSDSNKTLTKGSILVGIQDIDFTEFTHYLDVTGNVETQLEAYISPELNGLIEKLSVKEGDYVKTGQTLATIDTEIIRNSIKELNTQLALAITIYNKQKELWDENIGSEIQYLQAKSNKEALENKLESLNTQLKMATIKAPFDAFVETVYQKAGEMGSPSRQLIHLVNLQDLNITANLSEAYLPNVHKGDTALIEFSTFPDIIIREPISVIGSVINPNNRTIKIQVAIKNKNKVLIPNIIANLKLIDQHFNETIVVPSIVVKNDAHGNNYVYIVGEKEDELFAKKTFVKTGKSYGNNTMIIEGLEKDNQLIIQGYNLVKNGSTIRIK